MKNSLEPAVQLSQIDPRTRYFSALGALFLLLLPLIPLSVLAVKFDWPIWPLLIYLAFAAALAIRYAIAAHARFGFALLDDGLWLQSGVFWRKAAFVPRERVQHTEVNHGPLDRKMGLAKLVIHTAGLRLQHLTIPGLTDSVAHALRDDLLKRTQPVQANLAMVPKSYANASEISPNAALAVPLPAPIDSPIEHSQNHQVDAAPQGDLAAEKSPSQ